jgi:hypothetical protein
MGLDRKLWPINLSRDFPFIGDQAAVRSPGNSLSEAVIAMG